MKYDNSGIIIGFYDGGPSHRGLSKANLTKLYRHALILGCENPEESRKYTFHGGSVPISRSKNHSEVQATRMWQWDQNMLWEV